MALYERNSAAINPDLASERLNATFNVKELTTLIDESEENTNERHRVEKIFSEDPNIPNPFSLLGLNSDDHYKTAIEIAKYKTTLVKKHNLENSPYVSYPLQAPVSLHKFLFCPTILNHSTEEQLLKFRSILENEKVFGTYSQTELGHGSDIKQLETTAIYDANTEEFVLNSPTLTSIKCWSSTMGRTATHTILMAQLYTKNECHGIHMFLVQIRDINDCSSLPGITVGEMGPKMGFHGSDNGFLYLKNVRIPRENMFMKYAKVMKDGTYVKPKFNRASYLMMVFTRTTIVKLTAVELGKACTIAIRYNAVRRQGKIKKDGEDVKILDYKTQQYKLFPQVALSYALCFVFKELFKMFSEVKENNEADKLNEFHSLIAGMKALCTSLGAEGSEICRQSCGGLGYLEASHLPHICVGLLASCTFEGDNTILRLQTARYLIKSVQLISDGKSIGETVEYLKGSHDYGQSSCMIEFVKVFESTTTNLVNEVFKKLNADVFMGESTEIAWQNNTIGLTKCAQFHVKVFIIQSLDRFLKNTEMSSSLCAVLEKLFQFLAVYWILESSGEFIEYGKVSVVRIQQLRVQLLQFLKDLRPNIVPLVDALDYSDASLQSVIGSYDGRAYERLFEYWIKLPSNRKQQLSATDKSKL